MKRKGKRKKLVLLENKKIILNDLKNSFKIKQINEGEYTNIEVLLDEYNICFKLIIFEIFNHIKRDLGLDKLNYYAFLNGPNAFPIGKKTYPK